MEPYLVVDNLIIQGRRYTVNDLDKLPSALDTAKLATRDVGEMLVFLVVNVLYQTFIFQTLMWMGLCTTVMRNSM